MKRILHAITLLIATTAILYAGTKVVQVGSALVSQSGTWTVQPGNTANTTAWLMTNSGEIPSGATQEQGSSNGTPITDTSSHAIFASQSGKQHHLTSLVVINSHATVATEIEVLDGSTVIGDYYCAAAGAGFSSTLRVSLIGSATTALNIKAVTNGANVYWTATGYYQ